MTKYVSRWAAMLAAVALAFTLAGCDDTPTEGDSATDGSGFVGSYSTKDTQGNDMTVTLDEEGSASGNRAGDDLTGSWKDEGSTVTITWSDGWVTKITKDGDSYSKTAFKDGQEEGSAVPAEKTK
ncbi:hypothetical protein AUC68_02290 [Methyloceanibacter methanicus]|uniref:Lipoprotein n=1 Tax=Methyloceanibacter methanicus TaxID=1774968 RepID=A0A1E3W2J5_9HYPH|nr:hypothetical protein [Methyloceanibacter methanicus]ODR99959.1 hypothetical protein AUC68_02290 [Methyloceanibacter methanicus]